MLTGTFYEVLKIIVTERVENVEDLPVYIPVARLNQIPEKYLAIRKNYVL